MIWMLERRLSFLTGEEKLEQTNLRTDIEKLTLFEEVSWRQKSRVLHLREGTQIPNFSMEWLIPIEEIMVLRALCLMESCLQIKV